MAVKSKRFAELTLDEIAKKQQKLQNKNTAKNETKAVNAFTEFLSQIGVEDTNFFDYTEQELNKYLKMFWFNARTKTTHQEYHASSLETIRYGLNRTLKKYGHAFDITKSEFGSFTGSIKAFKDVMTDLKQKGKGHVINYKEIIPKRKKNFN